MKLENDRLREVSDVAKNQVELFEAKKQDANLEMVKNYNGMSLVRLAFEHFEYYTFVVTLQPDFGQLKGNQS